MAWVSRATATISYESSPTAGDAACSVNGVVYGNNSTFTIALPSSTESLRPTEHWPGLPAYTPGPNTYTASSNANATTTSPTDASNTTDTPPVITSAGLVLFTGGAAANAAGGVMAAAGLVAAALL
ncbi:MAG: hypothetical protein M1830_001948 [Pleopsidium flavum]|nr:MAG: hypothetical protein M1830_001948 [Pleopsidium flavum]